MRNYFDDSWDAERPEYNDDYCERAENRPAYSLEEATEYDKEFVNKILNYDILTDSDKQNIADTMSWYMHQLAETTEITKSFEDFCIEVMGEEWHRNMANSWLRRKNNELAAKMGLPELYNSAGIFLIMPGEEKEGE